MEKFRFDIGIKVYFHDNGKYYEGTIVKQVYTRSLRRADYLNSAEDYIEAETTYYVESSIGLLPFSDFDFHKNVFIDKKLFLETIVIHK